MNCRAVLADFTISFFFYSLCVRMQPFQCKYCLLFVALWSLSFLSLVTAWSGIHGGKLKEHLDPNVRDWGDYSDLPPGVEHGLGLEEEGNHGNNRGVSEPYSVATELDLIDEFEGKKRLWVITAPSHNDHYLLMMERQLEETEQKGLNCRLAERDTFIITIIQNAIVEGRIQKTTIEGEAIVESLDTETVTRLLHQLDLTSHEFNMLLIKKSMRVSERFPYPVRVEAILELIDQFPLRKLEKMTRKGSNSRCKTTKKKLVVKRKKKTMPSPHRRGNTTSVVPLQRNLALYKKAALKNRIQDILNGRARFVIRKVPPKGAERGTDSSTSDGSIGKETVSSPLMVSKSDKDGRHERPDSTVEEEKQNHDVQKKEDKRQSNKEENTQEKDSTKKKGKGKKGKKGKGRGKKSNREPSEKDITALKELLDTLRGTRRLMVISTPSKDATLYVQQNEENKKQQCQLAIRKVTVATIVGGRSDATLTLQNHQLESEPLLSVQSQQFSDPGLISLLRTELGLSSSDLFSMTVTDYDIEPNRVFEAPPSSTALFEYIDKFPSRQREQEKERKNPSLCSEQTHQPAVQSLLLRFMSKRRLLLISAPTEEDYSLQQQLSALRGHECQLGIRHFAMLKLTGTGQKASGTVELFPLNGRSQSEVELLSTNVVNSVREELKITKDYFSMLIVGKDGDVKAWFPSPMWSLDSIYDLVDSMELRLQEEKMQKRMGIHCPEEREGGGSEEGH